MRTKSLSASLTSHVLRSNQNSRKSFSSVRQKTNCSKNLSREAKPWAVCQWKRMVLLRSIISWRRWSWLSNTRSSTRRSSSRTTIGSADRHLRKATWTNTNKSFSNLAPSSPPPAESSKETSTKMLECKLRLTKSRNKRTWLKAPNAKSLRPKLASSARA